MSCKTCLTYDSDDYFCHFLLKAKAPNDHCSHYKNKFRRCKTCDYSFHDRRCKLHKKKITARDGCNFYRNAEKEEEEEWEDYYKIFGKP